VATTAKNVFSREGMKTGELGCLDFNIDTSCELGIHAQTKILINIPVDENKIS
jgi:hypothetical protein